MMSGASNAVPLMGRIYDLECKLDEIIRRLVSKEPLDDMVAEPLSAADVEEILHPPREDKKVIVGGYYKTRSADRHPALVGVRTLGDVYVGLYHDYRRWHLGEWGAYGKSLDGQSAYDLDLSTYQPRSAIEMAKKWGLDL